jgi:hypothetical protein
MRITARPVVRWTAGWLVMSASMGASTASPLLAQDSARAVNPARDSAKSASARMVPRALADLLADASRRNALPPALLSYKANVETELAVLLWRTEGTESVAALENVASSLRWTRTGVYDQRVIGYRAQGVAFSMLSAVRSGWLNPTLYGNRLRIRAQRNATVAVTPPGATPPGAPSPRVNRRGGATTSDGRSESVRADGSDTLPAVHPLATDREAFYRYSGGDTVVTMRVAGRSIPIVSVRVQPRTDVRTRVLLFDGEIALDASRGALVRLRGHFVRLNESRGIMGRLMEAVAFIDYENAEHGEQFWLPSTQRIELQVASPATGEGRAVLRIVSRFGTIALNDTTLDAANIATADSLRALGIATGVRRFSYAPRDSIDRYDRWQRALGVLTQGMRADDFDDIGPDKWRPTGAPRVDITAPRASDVLHFNRVEGLFTGAGVRVALRDLAPGVTLRALGGYAWSEHTVRGRLAMERRRGPWTLELRGGRSLDHTNDFLTPLDSGPSVFGVFGSHDPYDYVDRLSSTVVAAYRMESRSLLARLELGTADDRYRASTYVRGPFGGDPYRANRGVDEGGYVRSAAVLDWHPDISAEFMRPGIGGRLAYERGDGTLSWQRAEARLTMRHTIGPFVAVARGDVGSVTGARIPPQQLFELGERQGLPGYEDKEFAGSRAGVVRGQLQYFSRWLQRPIRVGRRLMLPGIAPGASVGLQSGWTEISGDAARASVLRLGLQRDSAGALVPVSRATEGFRATASVGLRFFSGSLFVGAARPIDQAAKWKSLLVFGQQW